MTIALRSMSGMIVVTVATSFNITSFFFSISKVSIAVIAVSTRTIRDCFYDYREGPRS